MLYNEYFHFPLDVDHNLITTRHGGWAVLSDNEYQQLKKVDEGSELFKKLEEVGIILTEKSQQKVIQDLRIQNSCLYSSTNYHVIAVTNKCNFNCIYCHPEASPDKNEMSEETAEKVLDFIFSIPTSRQQIIIEGGEPLLKWELIKFLYQGAKKRSQEKNINLRFSFTSNLSLMTDKIAQELTEMNIQPCVSFDGPKEVHDKHRPFISGEGSYDKVVYWVKRLKKDYKIRVHGIPVITKLSLKYGAKAFIDEYLNLGENTVFFKPFRPSGRALSSFQELEMTPDEFYNFWREGIEYCLYLNKQGIAMKELTTQFLITNILSPYRRSMCHRRPCGAGISILSYNCDGTINGCDADRGAGFLDLGHVDKDDYSTIRAKALPLVALYPDLIPICSSCPFVAYCGLCLTEAIGRENDIYPKIPRSFSCQWQKKVLAYLFKKFLDNKEDAQILRRWQFDFGHQKIYAQNKK